MTEYPDCQYDTVGDLEYCLDHRPDITCNQCGDMRPVYYDCDYEYIMETGDTTCIPCAIDNRIKELEEQ